VSELSTCTTCYGYGFWATSYPSPMGPIDAEDGMPTQPCPTCGANANLLKTAKSTLTLVFTDWNPKWREEFLIFDEQQALFELEQAGLPHYPVDRERHLSFKLEHPLTDEEQAWLQKSKENGLFWDYFTDTPGTSLEGPSRYPANVHPLEYGLYRAWLSAVGPSARVGHDDLPFDGEMPESMKLLVKMRGEGIQHTTSTKKRSKR